MEKIYYKLNNNNLEKVSTNVVKINGRFVSNPTEEQLHDLGLYQRNPIKYPKCTEGYHAEKDKWVVVDNMWEQTWKIVKNEEIKPTSSDYEKIAEDYLHQVCVERGYTKREPTEYLTSSNARWKQDAEDYVLFRDQVMELTIVQMNLADNNEESMPLEEFRKSLPQITWTIE